MHFCEEKKIALFVCLIPISIWAILPNISRRQTAMLKRESVNCRELQYTLHSFVTNLVHLFYSWLFQVFSFHWRFVLLVRSLSLSLSISDLINLSLILFNFFLSVTSPFPSLFSIPLSQSIFSLSPSSSPSSFLYFSLLPSPISPLLYLPLLFSILPPLSHTLTPLSPFLHLLIFSIPSPLSHSPILHLPLFFSIPPPLTHTPSPFLPFSISLVLLLCPSQSTPALHMHYRAIKECNLRSCHECLNGYCIYMSF